MKKKFNSIGFTNKSAVKLGEWISTGGLALVIGGMFIMGRAVEWYRAGNEETFDCINEVRDKFSSGMEGGGEK